MSAQSVARPSALNLGAAPAASVAWTALALAERFLAVLLLAALAPLLAGLAAAVRALSGRSPLVAHRRVGRYGMPFWVLKVRTMWGPERGAGHPRARWVEYIVDEQGPNAKKATDPRVTHWLARLCRRFSLDELPQLVHVARGEMALVGPRPLTRTELTRHYGVAAERLLELRPGLTGLWQVMGRNRLSYRQRARLDLFYRRKVSLGLYFRILARTFPQVASGRDSW
jgi:exopolysaccharide production protein ExoY